MDLDYSWVSLQFALSKQHNVVITIANPHMQPVSSQSVIHKTHVIHSLAQIQSWVSEADGSSSRDDSAAVWERIRAAPVLHTDHPWTERTLAPSLLSATPPSLLELLTVHTGSSFLHWPINHLRSHTKSLAREDLPTSNHTNIKSTAKPCHYSNSLSPHVPHAQTLPPPFLPVSLSRALYPSFRSWASSVKQPLQHFTIVNVG